jgi:hypothetical protein
MARGIRRTLSLTLEQRQELELTRDRDKRAYMRERAAALLKIADSYSARQVALGGLHKRRDPDTVYAWLNRYERAGLKGLEQLARAQRGFSPSGGHSAS